MRPFISFSGSSLIYAAFLLLILPIEWILAAAIAAGFHEVCHYAAVRVTGNDAFEIVVSDCGIVMKTTALSFYQELLCALAGPAGSLALFCCYTVIPRISVCAGIQGLFNLLPIYPLDGGRAYRVVLHRFLPNFAFKICQWTEIVLIIFIILLSIFFSISMKTGFGPCFLVSVFLSRRLSEKFLAKKGK